MILFGTLCMLLLLLPVKILQADEAEKLSALWYEVPMQQNLEQDLLYRHILYVSVLGVLMIALLLLLYARQRQKVRLAQLKQAGCEKERQFLALQKETERRLTRKYIDGLESERARMAAELMMMSVSVGI